MNPRQLYPTDLTDEAWDVIKSLLPEAKPGGRPEAYPTREILSGIFSLLRHGCSWCMLPHDLPPWRTVYSAFWPWCKDGTWEVMHDLRRGDVRLALGRQRQPSAGNIDCQSVKTTKQGGAAAMMPPNMSRVASAIASSIR